MFRHKEYVQNSDYPFNAGYVIYANYFFPPTSTGEPSDTPVEFPKAFEYNFKYFVDNVLKPDERNVILKSFVDKKSPADIANEMGITTQELTSLRTRAFVKLRSLSRYRKILSDIEYVPTEEKKLSIQIGDITVETLFKVPDMYAGGQEYRLISIKNKDVPLMTIRMSTKTNCMSDDEIKDFMVEVAKIVGKVRYE